jgi:di/tricarboxylate transporter
VEQTAPDGHGIAVLLLTIAALVLFTRERIPLEMSSLIILVALITGFHFFPYDRYGIDLTPGSFIAGFGNKTLITICSLMIVAKALQVTGALKPVAVLIGQAWSTRPVLAMFLTLLVSATFSAFVNNTPIIVLLIPLLVGMAATSNFPVSGLMLPMGLATIIGGTTTTIGTSTNLLAVGIANEMLVTNFDMFDFVLPAAIVGGLGLTFLWLVAPRLLPHRTPPMANEALRVFSARLFIDVGSMAAGKSLAEVRRMTGGRMRIDQIQRGDSLVVSKLPQVTLQPGDRLLVRDAPQNLKDFEAQLGAKLFNMTDSDHPVDEDHPLNAAGQQLAQVVITPASPLYRKTLAGSQFAKRSEVVVLALHHSRPGAATADKDIENVLLRSGDILLLQGPRDAIRNLKSSGNMLLLEWTTDLPQPKRAKRAIAAMAFVVLAAALGLMPIMISALIGVLAVVAFRCLSWRDATKALSIPVIMLIVASLALGSAMMGTGMADYLATGFVAASSGLSTPMVLSALILLIAILTNIVSNNAAAVIGTPIAVAIAQQLGADPIPFVLAVIFGANMSFATPFGYHDNLLIMGAGGYTFSDFMRVGAPLLIIMWIGYSIVLPYLYDVG